MSSAQSPEDREIEQTKQQIRSLVAEIAQLSKTDVAPEEFYGEFLPRVVSALAAVGGAVWTANDEGRLALQYQINLQETQLRDDEEDQTHHGRLLYKALEQRRGHARAAALRPGRVDGDDGAGRQPDRVPAGARPAEDRPGDGRPGRDLPAARGRPGHAEGLSAVPAADVRAGRRLPQEPPAAPLLRPAGALDPVGGFHARASTPALDPRETAYTIANEGRRLIECDRVSVAIRKGNKCAIEAISGQDVFDKRSNTVRLLGKLATAVVATGDAVWYTGDTRDLPPQVEDAVQEYVDEAHSKTVAVLPLRAARRRTRKTIRRSGPRPTSRSAALIVEQIEDSRVPASLVQRVDVVCRHSSTALGQRPGASEPVPDAGVAGDRQDPLGRQGPHAAQDAQHRRRRPGWCCWCSGHLAGRFHAGVQGHAGAGRCAATCSPASTAMVDRDRRSSTATWSRRARCWSELRNTELEVAITEVEGKHVTTGEQLINSLERLLLESRQRSATTSGAG